MMKKLDYITVLRAIAILSVLIVHISQQSEGTEHIHPYLLSIFNDGARGVQLFYLLSAFTLFHSFNFRSATENNVIRNYFIRRFFRIAPLYYLAIIYYLWQDGTGPRYWLGNAKNISTGNIISNFTFLHGFNPYWIASLVPGGWSIAIEVIFYCFLPILFIKIKNIRQAFIFTLITLVFRTILLLFFARHVFISDQRLWNEYLFLYFPNQLPIFALGIILYFLIYDKDNIKLNSKYFLAIAIILFLSTSIQQNLIIPIIFEFGIAFVFLTLALHGYHPPILFNRFFRYIGKISFTIYLTHWAAIHFLDKFKIMNLLLTNNESYAFLNFFLNFGMVLSLTVFLSTILYYTIELPMQKLGSRLIEKYNTLQ